MNMPAWFFSCLLMALGLSMSRLGAQAHLGDAEAVPGEREMQRIETSIDLAVEYLALTQNPDGSWPSSYGQNNGVNGICLLAFLGRGHVPGRGPFSSVVDGAIAFILNTQSESGLYSSPNPSRGQMYEHGLATLAMIEAYGFVPTAKMRSSVQSAVTLIVKAQSNIGGWRYHPRPGDHDLSVTVMQVVALRAATNARLEVPEKTLKKALEYVRRCIVPSGGFAYQPGGGPLPARTAAGCLSLQLLGAFDDPAVKRGLEYLVKRGYGRGINHFWYMNYYAMQAQFQAGGKYWASWHPRVQKLLLKTQKDDGSWPGFTSAEHNGRARCYSTAMGAMALEVYMHYLPAYQR